MLRLFHNFAKAYIDNIMIFSKTFEDHFQYLRTIFKTIDKKNVTLNPEKTFLGYSSIVLLKQLVDTLSMTTATEKLAAIVKLAFPTILKALKRYLSLTR